MGEVAWWHTYENFRACRLEEVRLQLPGFPDEDWPEKDKKVVKMPLLNLIILNEGDSLTIHNQNIVLKVSKSRK